MKHNKKCDNCEKKFTYPLPYHKKDSVQYSDALGIKFFGGYGMYIDPIEGNEHVGFFCKECADKLKNEFPGITKIIQRR